MKLRSRRRDSQAGFQRAYNRIQNDLVEACMPKTFRRSALIHNVDLSPSVRPGFITPLLDQENLNRMISIHTGGMING